MSRPATWLLTKQSMKVSCFLTDAEFEALPHVTLTGLLGAGVVVKRLVAVSLAEFVEIGELPVLIERGLK